MIELICIVVFLAGFCIGSMLVLFSADLRACSQLNKPKAVKIHSRRNSKG